MIPVCQSFNILQDKGFRQCFSYYTNIFKQQTTTLIVQTSAQSCETETLTRRAADNQSSLSYLQSGSIQHLLACYINNAFVDNGKPRLISIQRFAACMVNLHTDSYLEASSFKTNIQTACP